MKKLFSLFAAAVMAVSMMAATTFTYSSSVDAQTKDGFTVTLAQGTGQNEPKAVNNYDTKVDEVRLYLGNTITVSGASITGVELTFTKQGAKDYATLSADGGNLVSGGTSTSNNDPKTDVWTGSATSVTFELGTKGQRILTKVVVYGEGGDTPTPPTPVGDEITVAEAEAIAGALKDNETTTTTYTIKGYVGTLFDPDFYLVAEAGGRSDLQVYKPTVDRALTKGDYVQVVGKLKKYISKAGKTTLEVVSATVTHIPGTGLAEIMQNAKVKKMFMKGQMLILKNNQVYDLSGRLIK